MTHGGPESSVKGDGRRRGEVVQGGQGGDGGGAPESSEGATKGALVLALLFDRRHIGSRFRVRGSPLVDLPKLCPEAWFCSSPFSNLVAVKKFTLSYYNGYIDTDRYT